MKQFWNNVHISVIRRNNFETILKQRAYIRDSS